MSTPIMLPAELARQSLKHLTDNRVQPLPENYCAIYHRIAGHDGIKCGLQINHNGGSPDNVVRQMSTALCKVLDRLLVPHLPQEMRDRVANLEEVLSVSPASEISASLADIDRLLLHANHSVAIKDRLLSILYLMTINMEVLAIDEDWVRGQMSVIRKIIDEPLTVSVLDEAEQVLQAAVEKQAALKEAMKSSQAIIRNEATAFIAQMASMEQHTGDYGNRMSSYNDQLSSAGNVADLQHIVHNLMNDTSTMTTEMRHAREQIEQQQSAATEADNRIKELESEISRMSGMVHTDFLTGALNRRGMEVDFGRELVRSDRQKTTVSLALLDIDHFKKLNDTYGHATGDDALRFLSDVARKSLRATDLLSRFGGEEFAILMPDTAMESAEMVMTRMQRALTKELFMSGQGAEQANILVTFSAGVAQRFDCETLDSLLARADAAMYAAKHSGRNKVCCAEQELSC